MPRPGRTTTARDYLAGLVAASEWDGLPRPDCRDLPGGGYCESREVGARLLVLECPRPGVLRYRRYGGPVPIRGEATHPRRAPGLVRDLLRWLRDGHEPGPWGEC